MNDDEECYVYCKFKISIVDKDDDILYSRTVWLKMLLKNLKFSTWLYTYSFLILIIFVNFSGSLGIRLEKFMWERSTHCRTLLV